MDRDFEKFRGGPTEATARRVHVTISPHHLILLNRNVYYQIGRPEAVHLGYNRQRDMIAIEPASPRLPDSFPVIAAGCGWRINAAPFGRHFGIRIDTRLKFVRPEIDGNTLLLKLNDTVTVGGWRRPRKGDREAKREAG